MPSASHDIRLTPDQLPQSDHERLLRLLFSELPARHAVTNGEAGSLASVSSKAKARVGRSKPSETLPLTAVNSGPVDRTAVA